ncbi:MAG: phosphoribosylformylglycinamidine synthase subunit PurQ [Bdellovibrionales bacterium]|nr:phosphoribosylformylglycinamidine synthase subunit PurQ [Bdellovibrionales bacterium]
MNKTIGVTRFPGTNCDFDVFEAIQSLDLTPKWLWYGDHFSFSDVTAVIIPGGFSYGDYLRCGALAAKTPVMNSVREFAQRGLPVLGICNGFQILCESQLLPGTLLPNRDSRFIDQWVELKLVNGCRRFGPESKGVSVRLPVAHGDGRFYMDADGQKRIEDRGQVWWSYQEDINGSIGQIAGVMNENKNVAGLMPHPERAMTSWMGGTDGKSFFTSLF